MRKILHLALSFVFLTFSIYTAALAEEAANKQDERAKRKADLLQLIDDLTEDVREEILLNRPHLRKYQNLIRKSVVATVRMKPYLLRHPEDVKIIVIKKIAAAYRKDQNEKKKRQNIKISTGAAATIAGAFTLYSAWGGSFSRFCIGLLGLAGIGGGAKLLLDAPAQASRQFDGDILGGVGLIGAGLLTSVVSGLLGGADARENSTYSPIHSSSVFNNGITSSTTVELEKREAERRSLLVLNKITEVFGEIDVSSKNNDCFFRAVWIAMLLEIKADNSSEILFFSRLANLRNNEQSQEISNKDLIDAINRLSSFILNVALDLESLGTNQTGTLIGAHGVRWENYPNTDDAQFSIEDDMKAVCLEIYRKTLEQDIVPLSEDETGDTLDLANRWLNTGGFGDFNFIHRIYKYFLGEPSNNDKTIFKISADDQLTPNQLTMQRVNKRGEYSHLYTKRISFYSEDANQTVISLPINRAIIFQRGNHFTVLWLTEKARDALRGRGYEVREFLNN